MKRTTYILFGMLLAGVGLIFGSMLLLSFYSGDVEDSLIYAKGENKTVQFPESKVVLLTVEPRHIYVKKGNGTKVSYNQIISFRDTPLKVHSSETVTGSFTYPSEIDRFMKILTVEDTVRISFNFPDEILTDKQKDMSTLYLHAKAMSLRLPAAIQLLENNLHQQEVVFENLHDDTLSLIINGGWRQMSYGRMENCKINALTVQGGKWFFNKGEVENLHLHLDNIRNWQVNTDSFHIDTEYLYGIGENNCILQKGECRQIVWKPQSKKALLQVSLKQAARVIVTEP